MFSVNLFSQNTVNIDSLKIAVEKMEDDSLKITVFYQLAFESRKCNSTEMLVYANKALDLAIKLKIPTEIAKSYHVLGIFYAESGDLKRALDYFFNSLNTLKEIGDKNRMGVALSAIARVYQMMENHEMALEYDLQALDISLKNNDTINVATNYNNIGADYNNLKNYNSAIENYYHALEIATKNKNQRLQALLHLNIGYTYQKTNDLDSSIINLIKAENLYTEINDNYGLANTYNKLAEYYDEKKINDSVIIFAKKALLLGENIGIITVKRQAFELLSLAFENSKNIDSAYKYLKLFNKLNDSIINTGNTKKITQLEMQYEFDKENEINEIKHKAEVRRQQNRTIFLLIAFFLTLLVVIFIFRSYRIKKKSEKELQDLNAIKDRFFRIISHDLKSPFTAFISISELLSNPNVNLSQEKVQYFAKSINKTAKSSYDLFQNLLLWSMSQRNNLKIENTEVNLNSLVTSTIDLLKSSADNKKINIIFQNSAPEITSFTDENIIKTVLRNLINNAIKFTNEDGKITIDVKKQENKVKISVSDTGTGISKENVAKLFKPEVHLSTSGTNEEKGTGLGLILCKELLEKIDGIISVESELNTGSKFTVTI